MISLILYFVFLLVICLPIWIRDIRGTDWKAVYKDLRKLFK